MRRRPRDSASIESRDFYSIPAIYDVLHAPGTAGEVDAIIRLARRFHPPAAHRGAAWLEPACGTARHLRLAAKRGFRAIGFDHERAMIDYARARLPRSARLFVAPMERFVLPRGPRAALAFNLINSIRHLPSDAAMLRHLGAVRRALDPGGIYIVGIGLAAYGLEAETEDVWKGRRGACRVTQVVQYLPASGRRGRERDERVVSHLTVRAGRSVRDIDSTYTLFSYDLAQWRRVLARARFDVLAVADQDGHDTPPVEPGYALWVLRPRPRRRASPPTKSGAKETRTPNP